jgi:hypothetical protein
VWLEISSSHGIPARGRFARSTGVDAPGYVAFSEDLRTVALLGGCQSPVRSGASSVKIT